MSQSLKLHHEAIAKPPGALISIQTKPMEFEHEITCGTHRFYPKNRSAEHMCAIARRKCLISPDVQKLMYIGINFKVTRAGKELEHNELMTIVESKFKAPKVEEK